MVYKGGEIKTPINELTAGRGLAGRDFRTLAKVLTLPAIPMLLSGCTNEQDRFLKKEGYSYYYALPVIENSKIDNKNPLDRAKAISAIYAEKDGNPFLIYEKKAQNGSVQRESYPIHLLYVGTASAIKTVMIIAPDDPQTKDETWKKDPNKFQALLTLELKKPVSKETLDNWQTDPDSVDVKTMSFWDPLNGQGIIAGEESNENPREVAMLLIAPSIARPSEQVSYTPTAFMVTPAETSPPPVIKTPLPPPTIISPTAIPPTKIPVATEAATVKLSSADFVTDVAKLSEAVVVPDGQEAEYANAILALYKDKTIENFSDQVVPAKLNPGKIYKSVGFGTAYEIAGDLNFYNDVSMRPFKGVTLFNDGQGGFKMPMLWLQPDRTVGLIWFHLPQKTSTFVNVHGGSIFSVINFAFNIDSSHYTAIMTFQNQQGCNNMVGDTAFCKKYMSETSVSARDAAINSLISSGFVPTDMTSGKIQFVPAGGTN